MNGSNTLLEKYTDLGQFQLHSNQLLLVVWKSNILFYFFKKRLKYS